MYYIISIHAHTHTNNVVLEVSWFLLIGSKIVET